MGILFGVLAAFFWGVGDFFITLLTRRVGTRWALVSIQVLSVLAWILLLFGGSIPAVTPGLWGVLLATAVCHVLGLAFVYRAFEIGNLALVSPISSAFAIVTAILSLASGERPPALVLAGSALLIVGVTLATRGPQSVDASRATLRGVPEALASAVAFGTMFWLFYFYVQPRLGYAMPLVTLKALAVCGSALALVLSRSPERTGVIQRGPTVVFLAVGAAAADTAAWLTYIGGTHTSYATVVTALASLFSVVTVLFAWRFLGDRLAVHQWAGVGVILLGILLVSV